MSQASLVDYNSVLSCRGPECTSRGWYSYKLHENAIAPFGLDVIIDDRPTFDESKMSIWVPYADGTRRDGVGDLLEVAGIDTSRHTKNPLCLYDHGKVLSLPIGSCEDPDTGKYYNDICPVTKKARVQSFFYRGKGLAGVNKDREYDHAVFCEQLFDLMVKRFVRGGSIGYQVVQARHLDPDYERGTPQGLHLIKTLMLEASVVVMPANADTVREKGLIELPRQICSMPRICGKPTSKYLVKSLQPLIQKKAVLGYEKRDEHKDCTCGCNGTCGCGEKRLTKSKLPYPPVRVGDKLSRTIMPPPAQSQRFLNGGSTGGQPIKGLVGGRDSYIDPVRRPSNADTAPEEDKAELAYEAWEATQAKKDPRWRQDHSSDRAKALTPEDVAELADRKNDRSPYSPPDPSPNPSEDFPVYPGDIHRQRREYVGEENQRAVAGKQLVEACEKLFDKIKAQSSLSREPGLSSLSARLEMLLFSMKKETGSGNLKAAAARGKEFFRLASSSRVGESFREAGGEENADLMSLKRAVRAAETESGVHQLSLYNRPDFEYTKALPDQPASAGEGPKKPPIDIQDVRFANKLRQAQGEVPAAESPPVQQLKQTPPEPAPTPVAPAVPEPPKREMPIPPKVRRYMRYDTPEQKRIAKEELAKARAMQKARKAAGISIIPPTIIAVKLDTQDLERPPRYTGEYFRPTVPDPRKPRVLPAGEGRISIRLHDPNTGEVSDIKITLGELAAKYGKEVVTSLVKLSKAGSPWMLQKGKDSEWVDTRTGKVIGLSKQAEAESEAQKAGERAYLASAPEGQAPLAEVNPEMSSGHRSDYVLRNEPDPDTESTRQQLEEAQGIAESAAYLKQKEQLKEEQGAAEEQKKAGRGGAREGAGRKAGHAGARKKEVEKEIPESAMWSRDAATFDKRTENLLKEYDIWREENPDATHEQFLNWYAQRQTRVAPHGKGSHQKSLIAGDLDWLHEEEAEAEHKGYKPDWHDDSEYQSIEGFGVGDERITDLAEHKARRRIPKSKRVVFDSTWKLVPEGVLARAYKKPKDTQVKTLRKKYGSKSGSNWGISHEDMDAPFRDDQTDDLWNANEDLTTPTSATVASKPPASTNNKKPTNYPSDPQAAVPTQELPTAKKTLAIRK